MPPGRRPEGQVDRDLMALFRPLVVLPLQALSASTASGNDRYLFVELFQYLSRNDRAGRDRLDVGQ